MTKQDKKLSSGVQKWFLKNIAFIGIVGAILFLSSGKIDWWMAWAYLAAMLLIMIANAIVMDPSLLVERSKLQEGTKQWDIALSSFVAIWGPLSIWIVAGLDVRLDWSQISMLSFQIAALVVFILGSLMATWAMKANRFFSSTVRIQKDRNHQVAIGGPYRYVRHPGYLGGIIAMLMTPLSLGSWIGLIPSVLVITGYILRTSLEDKVLLEELEGYKDYARKVPYRLLPMIW